MRRANASVAAVDGQSTLEMHREIWNSKPVLRRLYGEQFFAQLDRWAPGSRVVEVGAGPGYYMEHRPGVIGLDIVDVPWLDMIGDCTSLPVASGSLDGIVGLDVIHHLVEPVRFLTEVERVLRPGGRLVLVEPWNTPLSKFLYSRFHQEDFDLSWNPSTAEPPTGPRPFDGNQAIPYLLFERHWDDVEKRVPALTMIEKHEFSFVSYLLSGGFKPRSLLPMRLYPTVAAIERVTMPLWRRVASLRATIVLERQP